MRDDLSDVASLKRMNYDEQVRYLVEAVERDPGRGFHLALRVPLSRQAVRDLLQQTVDAVDASTCRAWADFSIQRLGRRRTYLLLTTLSGCRRTFVENVAYWIPPSKPEITNPGAPTRQAHLRLVHAMNRSDLDRDERTVADRDERSIPD